MSRILALMLTLAAMCWATAAEPIQIFRLRTWTDPTGRYSVEARFLELVEGNVRLKRADGKTLQLPLERLSIPDQQYLADTFSIRDGKSLGSEMRLVEMRKQVMAELSVNTQQFRAAQSALEAAEDERSKEMHEAEVRELERRRSQASAMLAVNRLSIEALYAPPSVSKRMEEAARRLSEKQKTQRTGLETVVREAETIRLVGQLHAVAERLRQIGKSDAAARVSREADFLEKELED